MRNYWVVSPNVRNTEATVSAWRQAVVAGRVAFMGWPPGEHKIGDRFVDEIERGDVILIARRHRSRPEIVGFGIVSGKAKTSIKGVNTPQGFGSARKLSPFIPMSGTPARIPVIEILHHNSALAKLHPGARKAHTVVCKWMERLLSRNSNANSAKEISSKTKTPEGSPSGTYLVDSPKNHQLDYLIQTKKQVTRASKSEARLLIAYRAWLERQGRKLVTAKNGKLQCDGFEKARCNLVEAKSSTSREHIRMAVGQLLDYAFQIESRFGRPNIAVLLPREPNPNSVNWLLRWNINLIWRKNGAFLDNANGQFT
jgi:hypothetical protein